MGAPCGPECRRLRETRLRYLIGSVKSVANVVGCGTPESFTHAFLFLLEPFFLFVLGELIHQFASLVFDFFDKDALERTVKGEIVGTIVK